MVIFSVFDSNPRLLFWAILSSKRDLLRFFSHFFVKVFAKVGWEILCFLWHKTENCELKFAGLFPLFCHERWR